MLTCVCRPVSGNLPKMPPASMMPASRASLGSSGSASSNSSSSGIGSSSDSGGGGFGSPTRVVTSEPKLNVSKLQAINYTARKQLKRRGGKDKESRQARRRRREEKVEEEVRKSTASQFKQTFATGV